MFDTNEVVFIDSQIQNPNPLIAGLNPNADVYHLNGGTDGVAQIGAVLAQYQNLDAVHIVSHGSEGSLQLGASTLNLENIAQYRQEIEGWSHSLGENADILFFGCNVAQGMRGRAFIQQIDALTGAEVAASTDLTGHASLGGDWELEAATGSIEARSPFANDSLNGYQDTLGTLSGNINSTSSITGDVSVTGNVTVTGDVTLDVDDFTLGSNFNISGDGTGAGDSLTINSGGTVTIAGDILGGGFENLAINAQHIRLTNGADIITTGDITLTALDKTIQTRLATFPTQPQRDATVDITGANLQGRDISILAGGIDTILFSGAPKVVQDLVLDPLISGSASRLINSVVPASVEVRNSSATINLTHSSLTGSGNVLVNAKATADGSVQALRGAYAYDQTDSTGQKIAKISTRIAAAVGYATTNARANLNDTDISAGSNVFITAHTETAARVKARLFGNLQFGGQGASTKEWGASVAVAYTNTTSKVLLDAASTIASDGNVAIDATGNVDSQAQAVTKIFVNGNAAAGIGVNYDTADINASIQGDITAKGELKANGVLDRVNQLLRENDLDYKGGQALKPGDFVGSESVTAGSINSATNTISFSDPHSFSNGETITYNNQSGNNDIGGLENGKTYVVRVLDDRKIQLTQASAIDLDNTGLNQGVEHSLSRQEIKSLNPTQSLSIGSVNPDTETIQVNNHGLVTGDEIIYQADSNAIAGLSGNTRYYAIVVDTNTLKLAETAEAAASDDSLDLTATGSGTIVKATIPQKTAATVDIDNDTLQVNNHGFETGDEVIYRTGGTAIAGLSDSTRYYAIKQNDNTLKLADSAANALAGVAIDLTSTGSGTQVLRTPLVNVEENTITLQNHGLFDGQEVTYRKDSEEAEIGGLETDYQYYAIVVDANTIKLAADREGVVSDNAIDLTDGMTGFYNQLEFFKQEASNTTFNPSGKVNTGQDALTIANHGFYNGQLVTYESNGGSAIGGLTDGSHYFVVVKDENTIQFATSQQNWQDGTFIDLTSAGSGSNHQFSFARNTSRFDPNSALDKDLDTFTLNNHGFQTGDAVVYNTDATYSEAVNPIISRAFDPTTAANLANNTIAINAQNIATGDKLTYQVDYLGGAGTAIGGLTANQEYYAIKVDDSTIKLATSFANATAGNAIALTSAGTGTRHLFVTDSEGTIKLDDRAIRGLDEGGTYYVTVLDDNTFQLSASKAEAEAAQPIDLTGAIAGTGHDLDKGTARKQGISINAALSARDRVSFDGSTGSNPKWRDFLSNPDLLYGLRHKKGFINPLTSKDYLKGKKVNGQTFFDGADELEKQSKNEFSLGLGVGINVINHAVLAEVGASAELKSDANVTVNGTIEQRVKVKGKGQTGKDEAGTAIGLAIGVGEFNNSARAIVQSGATIDAREAIEIASKVEYPFTFNYKKGFDFADEPFVPGHQDVGGDVGNVIVWLKDLLIGGNLLVDKFANTFVTTKNKGKVDKGAIKGNTYGLNASIAVMDYDNVSEAIIGAGALINQNGAYRTAQQSVSVKADTNMVLTGATGIVHMDLGVDVAYKAVKKKDASEAFNFFGNRSQSGFGASVFAQLLNNRTIARIDENARVHTGTSGAGFSVSANEKLIAVDLAQSGADVAGVGLTGSGMGFEHTSQTIAQLKSGVKVTGGKLGVKAYSHALRVNLAMSAIASASTGIGLAVAIDNSDRQVEALIGDRKTSNTAPGSSTTDIDVTAIDLDAKVDGFVFSLALAGNKTVTQQGSPTNAGNAENSPGFLDKVKGIMTRPGGTALGITGGVAGNLATESARAYIYDSGSIYTNGQLSLKSENATEIIAASGVASYTGTQQNSAGGSQNIIGISAGVSFNQVDLNTQSFIEGASVTAHGGISLAARKHEGTGSGIFAVSVTPSLAYSSNGQGTFALNIGGSAAFNLIESNTESYIKGFSPNSLLVQGEIDLAASDRSKYHAGAGTLALGLLTSNSKYTAAGTIGLSLATNQIDNKVRSYVEGARVIGVSGDNQLEAISAIDSLAVAVAGSVSADLGSSAADTSGFDLSLAAAGAGAWNTFNNHEVAAFLKDGDITANAIRNLTLNATDNSKTLALAGGVSISAITNKDAPLAISIGASGAVNEFKNSSVRAYLENSTAIANTINLNATARAEAKAIAFVGAGAGASSAQNNLLSGAFAGAGAGAANYIRSNVIEARIFNTDSVRRRVIANRLSLNALDETALETYAIGVSVAVALANGNASGSGAIAAGVAIAKNEVRNTVNANISQAKVEAFNSGIVDVDLQALSNPNIKTINVAGAVGAGSGGGIGFGVAVGVSHAQTTLSNTVTATIDNAELETRANTISLLARLGDDNTDTVETIGGSVALSLGWSNNGIGISIPIAASVAYNKIVDNTVRAKLENTQITAGGDITLAAEFKPGIHATNFGVAAGIAGGGSGGSVGIAAVGAGIGSYNDIAGNTTEAIIDGGSNATSTGGNVKLAALDKSRIKAHGGTGALAITGSNTGLGLSASVGASVAVNRIGSELTKDANGNWQATEKANILRTLIEGSGTEVNAHHNVELNAKTESNVDSLNISLAASVSVNTDNSAVGVSLAGAGIGSYNTINNSVEALVQQNANVTANTGSVLVTAEDNATIKADGGAVSLSIGIGGTAGVSAAIGVAIAENTVSNTLKAWIDNATVTAHRDIIVTAESTAKIDALNFGAALAASFGSNAGVALGGAGVGSVNNLSNTIRALIQNGTRATVNTGEVKVNAKDTSTIETESYVVSLAVAGGGQAGVAVGAAFAKADNALKNTVEAFIDSNAEIYGPDLSVEAAANANINAKVVTFSGAIGISTPLEGAGVGVAASGVFATNQIENTINAFVRNSHLGLTRKIDVKATDTNAIDATYGVGSLSVGTTVGLAMAVASTKNHLKNNVSAYIDNASIDRNNLAVNITATENATATTDNRFASVGIGIVGLAGAGAESSTIVDSETVAYGKGSSNWTVDDLKIIAESNTTTLVKVHGGAGSLGVVGASAGAALATATDNSKATAYFDRDNNATLTADNVEILATAKPKVTADALFIAIAGGLVGVAGAGTNATATINPTVTAYVGNGTIVNANNLTVRAKQDKPEDGSNAVEAIATTGAGAASLGGLTVDITVAKAYANGTVKAYIDDNARIFVGNDVTVEAINNTKQFAGKEGVASGGFSLIGASGGALHTQTHSNKTTEAYLGNNVALTANNLTVRATGKNEAKVEGVTFSASGIGIAARAGYADTHSTSTTRAYIGNGSATHRIKVFDKLDIDANYTHEFDKKLVIASASLAFAGSGAEATHNVNSTVKTDLGNNLQIEARQIHLNALNTSRKLNREETSLRSASGGLLLGLAFLNSKTDIDHTTEINIGTNTSLRQYSPIATHGIDLHAKNIIDIKEKVTAQSYGIIGAGKGEAEIEVDSTAAIAIGAGATLEATGNLNAIAHSLNTVETEAYFEAGGLAAGGEIAAKTDVTANDTLTVGGNLSSLGEILLAAGTGGKIGEDSALRSTVSAKAEEVYWALIAKAHDNGDVQTLYNRNHNIEIQSGAKVASAKDLYLNAFKGTAEVAETGIRKNLGGSNYFDDGATETDDIGVTVNGTLQSNYLREKVLTVTQGANDTIVVQRSLKLADRTIAVGDAETWSLTGNNNLHRGVTLYSNNSYGGTSYHASDADRQAQLTNLNSIRSLKVEAGYKVILYSGQNFQGTRKELTAGSSAISNFNTVGSWEIVKEDSEIAYDRSTTTLSQLVSNATTSESLLFPAEFEGAQSGIVNFTKGSGDWNTQHDRPRMLGDVNGDGNADIVAFGSSDTFVALSNGNGTFAAPINANLNTFTPNRGGWTSQNTYPRMLGDVNGDGNADIVAFGNSDVYIAFSNGNGTFATPINANLNNFTPSRGGWSNQNDYPRHIGDVNGDGKADIVAFGSSTVQVALSNGNGTFTHKGSVIQSHFTTSHWGANDIAPRTLGDVNGDGKADIVAFGQSDAVVALGKSDGTFQTPTNTNLNAFGKNAGGWQSQNEHPRYVADVNGDGKDDLVGFGGDGIYIALSKGDGTFAAPQKVNNGFGRNHWASQNDYPRMLADVNGDNFADVVGFGHANVSVMLAKGLASPERAIAQSAIAAQNAFTQAQLGSDLNQSIHLVETQATHLDLGRIIVTGNYLQGTGTLDASANNAVKIHNSSNASVKIGDIEVSGTGGELLFNYAPIVPDATHTTLNAAINQYNPSDRQANFNSIQIRTNEDGSPEIDIRNTSSSRTVLQISGDIDNTLGTVRARNISGDTLVNGNVRAHAIDISTGENLIQTYTTDARHLGGQPTSNWWNTANASARNNTTTNLGSSSNPSSIVGDNVFIAGRYLNLSGTVQAGRDNHSAAITNTAQFEAAISRFETAYQSNPSKHLFDFEPENDGISTQNANDKPIRLQWNARDNRIEVRNIDVAGGQLELHGHIISTGNGRLKVLDGYSRISLENPTTRDLQLSSFVNKGLEGRIKITDTGRSNGSGGYHVTEIERIGDQIRTSVNDALASVTTGRTATYAPKANQVYTFETSLQRKQTEYWRKEQGGTGFGFLSIVYWTDYEKRSGDTDVVDGIVTLKPNSGSVQSAVQAENYAFANTQRVNNAWQETSQRFQGNENAGTYRSWHYEKYRTYTQHHTHSVKADLGVAIEFIGDDSGVVSVQSPYSKTILDGTFHNANGTTTIDAKEIGAIGTQGIVYSDNVTLTARDGIDNLTINATRGGWLNATTTNGDIAIDYAIGSVENAKLTAHNGDVSFKAIGDISGQFKGDKIALTSTLGNITGTVDTGNSDRSVLTATAKGDINLAETQGDLRVDRVESQQGDITLRVDNGNLLDGRTSAIEHQSVINELDRFASDSAIDNHIQNVEAVKQADYARYWQLRGTSNFNPDTYQFSFSTAERTALQNQGKTNAEITAMENQQTQWMKDRHAEFGNPTAYDANYVYRVSAAKKAEVKNQLTTVKNNLQTALNRLGNAQNFEYFFSLLNEDVSLATEEANAVGRNITLTAEQGSIGRQIGTPLTLNRNEILTLLTDEQKIALQNAEAKGIIQRQGENIIVSPKEDFDVIATGELNATADRFSNDAHAYLGSKGAITVGEIQAGGEVHLRGSDAIADGNGANNNITYGSNVLILPKDSANVLEVQKSLELHNGLQANATGVLDFDGENDYAQLNNRQTGEAMTFSAWVNYDSFNNWSRIFDFGDGANNNNILLANEGTSRNLVFSTRSGSTYLGRLELENFWEANTWIHVTASISASGVMKIYKNGDLAGTMNGTAAPTAKVRTNNYIGKSNWFSSTNFNGQMDDIQLLDRTLSDSEIQALYDRSLAPETTYTPGQLALHNGLQADSTGVLNFDGSNDYGEFANRQTGGAMTFSAWVNYDSFNNWSRIFDFGDGANNNNILLANEGTSRNLVFSTRSGSTYLGRLELSNFWEANTWTHVTATISESGVMQIYKNGELAGTVNGTAAPTAKIRTNNYIGKSNWYSPTNFDGQMGHVELLNRTLSVNEVRALYNATQRPA